MKIWDSVYICLSLNPGVNQVVGWGVLGKKKTACQAEIVETTLVGSRLTDSKQGLYEVVSGRNDTKRASFRVVLGTNRNEQEWHIVYALFLLLAEQAQTQNKAFT